MNWKKIKRIINYFLLFAVVIIIGIGISAYIYKDRIVRQLIREANAQINTPVRVGEVNLELFDKFPQIAIRFKNIVVEESWPQSRDPLLIAENIFVTLNPVKLLKGDYEINQIHIEDAEVFIRIDKEGFNNYAIFSKKSKGESSGDSLEIDLQRISLKNVSINYQDENNSQDHKYHTNLQQASVNLESGMYRIITGGDLTSEYIRIQGKNYAENKNTRIKTEMYYDPESRILDFQPSSVLIRDSKFSLQGHVQTGDEPNVDLHIEGIDTDIQSLVSLLPEDRIANLNEYRSEGEVYFDMDLKGYTRKNVQVDIEFGLRNAELTHPKLSKNATGVFLEGKFLATSFSNLSRSDLTLSNVKGNFGMYPFEGSLELSNLSDPVAKGDLIGIFEVEEIMNWLPDSRLNSGTGLVHCQITFYGRFADLRSRYTSQRVETSGEVRFENVVLGFEQDFPAPTTINGNFVFTRNDLAINNTVIKTGQSEWITNGYFRNILPYLLFEDQFIGIEADIVASFINLEEFLPPNSSDESDDQIRFGISPFLMLDFNCEVETLKYKRFEARTLSGDLKVKDSRIFAQNIEFNSMGGSLQFSGLVNASQENIVITSSSHWKNLAIDSVFYVFNNFNQDWLVAENLKGNAFADVITDMTFSPELKFFPDSLISDISITIEDGELNDFQPMIELEDYVEDDNLAHLKFSELQNDIHVENRKIYLPQMEVRSNVSNILVSGSHTFDQVIDYRVVVPLRTLGKNRDEEMFGAVENDGSGSKLHLKIVGTTTDYEIKYDAEGVKKKVVSDLKKEVQELKDAFKKKEVNTQEVTLNEEEFFEWEEDTIRNNFPKLPPH
jgi:hypothetical protein